MIKFIKLLKVIKKNIVSGFVVYPWHRSGSLTNASTPEEGVSFPSILNKKKMSNLRFSTYTDYNQDILYNFQNGNATPIIFDSKEVSLSKLTPTNTTDLGNIYYYGNVDQVSFKNAPYFIVATITGSTTSSEQKFEDIYRSNCLYK